MVIIATAKIAGIITSKGFCFAVLIIFFMFVLRLLRSAHELNYYKCGI
jgi:hypothetical protein